ncbi:MAG: DNA polymerase III subunit alpha [Breznakibacter sp.]
MFLNCHSYYSLRYGTMAPETLVKRAVELGIKTLALTDINNTSGTFDFVKACRENNIQPIVGMEFRNNNQLFYTALAFNTKGFEEINRFFTRHSLSQQPLPLQPPPFEHCATVYPFSQVTPQQLRDNEYAGIRVVELNRLIASDFRYHQHKLLVWQPITFNDRAEYELHKHLRAIDRNTLLGMVQPTDCAAFYEMPVTPQRIRDAFAQYPEIWNNTKRFIQQCTFDFDFGSAKNKKVFTDAPDNDKLLLEQLAYQGMADRYGANHAIARERIEKELHIIHTLGFSAYFLIAHDLVRHAMANNIYHVGRGSGANSVVAYCLRITDVDPIELNLYFERFLNPKRTSPPDFDLDFSWQERDRIQQYLFDRYGSNHTALLGATNTFQGKSIIRELGKVYGLPKNEIDELVENQTSRIGDGITRRIGYFGSMMDDFPNVRSIHAGGIIISEKPITCYTALDLPQKGFATTQWDMYTAETIGFEKLDILSQRGIGHIKDCVTLVAQNRGVPIDIHRVEEFKEDAKVKQMLAQGETTGCFYIESPAMRGLLKKLQCRDYLTLVAASSIIRPGVAKSGMMRQYIQRFHNPHGFNYLHPVMKEQLEETYGVMVYQEDVLKVCHHFAGLDLADADVLRRAMSGKFRSKAEFQRIVDKFFSNCRAKGYQETLIQEVWRQIESFAGYSFSKAHSASYAVESFQSLYLKAYHPLEFMVAVINNFGGFYSTWLYVNEARRWGANILPPCVNRGEYLTSIQGSDITIGFIHIQNLDSAFGQRIAACRRHSGPYADMDDFIQRTGATREQMILLIRSGAFSFLHTPKADLLWQMHLLLYKGQSTPPSQKLFTNPVKHYQLPKFEHNTLEDAYDELELFGFTIGCRLFDLLETKFRGELMADQLLNHVGKKVRLLGQLVTIKYVRTTRKEIMHFGTFIDASGEFFDTVHFPSSLQQYPFKGDGIYLMLGTITEEYGHPSLEVEKMAKMPLKPDPRG